MEHPRMYAKYEMRNPYIDVKRAAEGAKGVGRHGLGARVPI